MKGLRGLAADEVGQRRNDRLIWDGKSAAEVVPESDAQLGAGLGQAKEGIPAVATDIAAGTAADFAFGDLAADIVLRGIGVQRDVRVVERGQQFGLVGMQPLQQAVESDEAGATAEDVVEPLAELGAPPGCRCPAVVLEVGIELPDQRTHLLLGGALVVGERVQLVHEPLCVDPTQRVLTDGELAGVIADNHGVAQKVMRLNAAPVLAAPTTCSRSSPSSPGCWLRSGWDRHSACRSATHSASSPVR